MKISECGDYLVVDKNTKYHVESLKSDIENAKKDIERATSRANSLQELVDKANKEGYLTPQERQEIEEKKFADERKEREAKKSAGDETADKKDAEGKKKVQTEDKKKEKSDDTSISE